jgi:hypothetical protein
MGIKTMFARGSQKHYRLYLSNRVVFPFPFIPGSLSAIFVFLISVQPGRNLRRIRGDEDKGISAAL